MFHQPSVAQPSTSLVADGDADPARRGVAQLEIGVGRRRREADGGGARQADKARAAPTGSGAAADIAWLDRVGKHHCLRAINHG